MTNKIEEIVQEYSELKVTLSKTEKLEWNRTGRMDAIL